ncbi:hypothetical protein CKQ79_28570, partial [Klebsiella pneumoniae]
LSQKPCYQQSAKSLFLYANHYTTSQKQIPSIKLLHRNSPIDDMLNILCFPILLTSFKCLIRMTSCG